MVGKFVYIITLLFFMIGTIFTGYIMESDFLIMNACVYVAFLVVLLSKTPLIVKRTHLMIFILVICYWVSVLYAVDREAAIIEASRVSSIVPLSLMLSLLAREQLMKLLFKLPWLGSFLVLAGVVFQLNREGRLESFFQYANALAILLSVCILISIMAIVMTKSKLHIVLITINVAGLLLTFSRSVWVLWLVSVIMMFILIPILRNKRMFIVLSSTHLLGLILAMLVKQDIWFFLNRVSSIQTKTSEFQIRFVYWKDSIRMFIDYALGGAGGGGWALLQQTYQSQSYFVKFIHNHYIQVFLDVGLIGGLAFLAIIILFYKNALVQLKTIEAIDMNLLKGIVIMVTMMLLHAGFDFDLTYPYLNMLLIGLMLLIPQQSLNMKGAKIKYIVVVPIVVLLFSIFMWIGVGYQLKEKGIEASKQSNWEQAGKQLEQVRRMVSWSNTIIYEKAKLYIRMGNETGDTRYYDKAESELERATEMVPQKKLYTDLLKDLQNER
ncbi:O-antigen ligase family protein [Paenibacillus sinopodophylli]|uniref:O-antigen ligase family protein n=1 Tax=Paenibacillus sinopodophylli TaxID=1837342 RepID=UPI00110CB5A2|nr:O-antigen ligase family protein [Paenibacillus sinopodophylli]